jgi:hypothetical protein
VVTLDTDGQRPLYRIDRNNQGPFPVSSLQNTFDSIHGAAADTHPLADL